tara:strand:- start:30 stop:734 length:705 start_codon:yes stop_codon:yes gene_type:complete
VSVEHLIKKLIELESWYETPVGKKAYELVVNQVACRVDQIYPSYLLQIGGRSIYRRACDHGQVFVHLDPRDGLSSNGLNVCCDLTGLHLPVPANQFSMVICPYVHEMVDDSVALFEELSRVVCENGFVVLVGINMASVWGIEYLMGRLVKPQWAGSIYSLTSLLKILKRYDLSLEQYETVFFTPYTYLLPNRVSQIMDYLGHRYWPKRGSIEIIWLQKKEEAFVLSNQVSTLRL